MYDLDNLNFLSNQISAASKAAHRETGRKGCTTEELYDIIQSYFSRQIQQLVKSTAVDIAMGAFNPEDGGKTMRDAKTLLSIGRDVAIKYVKEVGQKADEHADENLNNLGISRSDLNLLARNIFKTSKDSFAAKNMRNEEINDDVEYAVETDNSSGEHCNVFEPDNEGF